MRARTTGPGYSLGKARGFLDGLHVSRLKL